MFDKILVALDTSEPYEAVFEAALNLARAADAGLLILGVLSSDGTGNLPTVPYPSLAGYPFAVPESAWDACQKQYEICKRRGLETLSRLQRRAVDADIKAKIFQDFGSPGMVICDRAKAEKSSIVVVGTHGRKGLNEFLTGSVSSYVMHQAPCSVLVVRDQSAGAEGPKSVTFTKRTEPLRARRAAAR